jgi:hypothetical protein
MTIIHKEKLINKYESELGNLNYKKSGGVQDDVVDERVLMLKSTNISRQILF